MTALLIAIALCIAVPVLVREERRYRRRQLAELKRRGYGFLE